MRLLALTISVALTAGLAGSAKAETPARQARLGERLKIRLAPVRVRARGNTLSVVHMGINNKRPMVKSITTQLASGTQVRKDFGYKVVGDKTHRSVLTTRIKPDGSAAYRLEIKGLLTKRWQGNQEYKPMTKAKARAKAVFSSPVTQGAMLIAPMAVLQGLTLPAAAAVKGTGLLSLFFGAQVWSANDSAVKPNVQNLNQ